MSPYLFYHTIKKLSLNSSLKNLNSIEKYYIKNYLTFPIGYNPMDSINSSSTTNAFYNALFTSLKKP